MARYGTLKRNVKRNIKHWSEEGEDHGLDYRIPMSRVMAVVIALALAFALIPLTMNIVFRIPDLYKFDLGRTSSVTDVDVGIENARNKIADAISHFMEGKTEHFQLTEVVDDNTITVFTAHDGQIMQKLRSFLDNMRDIGITAGITFLVLGFLLVKWGRGRELRRGFFVGAIIYFAITLLAILGTLFKGPAMTVWEDVIGAKFAPGDKMPALFFDGFILFCLIAMTVLSILILLVLFSLTRRLTRGKAY